MRVRFTICLLLVLSLYASVANAQSKPISPSLIKRGASVLAPAKTAKETALKFVASANAHPVEFLRDVAPILDRSGCSTAGCHGKFGGRGNFQMSLLTLSPEDDYAPIIYGARGRRVNFAAPEKSLLLLKATGAIEHGGGQRFAVGSPEYNTFLRWIKAGAPFSPKDPRLVALVIQPAKVTLPKVGVPQPLKVIATYTDGTKRDVTTQTSFQSTNDGVLGVTQEGVVTGKRWGGGAILGRYLGTIAASFFTLPQARKGAYPALPPSDNPIDRAVFDNLKRLNVIPSALSSDTEFMRRVTLDTLGRLPTPDEIAAFIADKAVDKRPKLIDALLAKPEFADLRAMRLSDLLRVHPRKLGNSILAERAAALFSEWIWTRVRDNEPWDQFTRELLLARGSTFQNGPTNFYRIEQVANDRMENIGQAFLGVRMSCARCHKHPFDRWNTDDYWNFSAFQQKVGLGGGKLYAETTVFYNRDAQLINQSVTGSNRGKIAPPTFLGDKTPAPVKDDMTQELADWITDAKNPFFARATVNRLWSYYFGRGIIHPVDDMRATTPAAVPGLLETLAAELVQDKYDVKRIIRLILNSRTYQLSSIPNPSNAKDDRFFSHFAPRPMPAQVLLDMLDQATGVHEQFDNFPERAKAVQASLPIGSEFLDAFGQSHREFLADLNPKLEPTLVQTLSMINSPYIESKVRNGTTLRDALKTTKTEGELVQMLYQRTFCRPPSPTELAKATTLLKQTKDRTEGAQDLLWALVTSREFYFNH